MAEIHIQAQVRDPKGTTTRVLRRTGFVPAVYYNRKGEIRCLTFERITLDNLLRKEIGLLHVDVNGESLACIIREVQRDPIRRSIVHVDLMGIVTGQKIRAHVPIHTLGTAAGIKEGGTLELILREVEVECEPVNLPTHIDVDVSSLKINDAIRVSDLHIDGVTVLDDAQATIVHVSPPRATTTETPAAAAETKEPEVIRERKTEADDEKEKK
jgi:large subunit ribosomal protein L25